MKNIYTKAVYSTIIVLTMFSALSVTYAADYTVLAPLPGIGENGGTTNLPSYLPAVFNLAIGIAAGLAFVMITFGGIMYATSDAISGKSQGREYIENALWGLLLVIGAYVILYTINPQILKFDLSLARPNIRAGVPTAVAGVPMTEDAIRESNEVKARLIGITVPNQPCVNGGVSGCTNLNGLPPNAIAGLNQLKINCLCNVTITGGTEGGHQTHGAGAPIVDMRPTPDLNSFLGAPTPYEGQVVILPRGNPPTGPRAGFTYETTGGNTGGTSTGAHWHVVFQ